MTSRNGNTRRRTTRRRSDNNIGSQTRRSAHASMLDLRDLDLMLKIEERADSDGWVETEEIASSMGFERQQPIGIRLSWMRRYGMLEFDEKKRMWRLTNGAGRVMNARLRATQSRTIEALPDESMVEVMANITSRYHRGDPMMATMLRREFVYGTQRRL